MQHKEFKSEAVFTVNSFKRVMEIIKPAEY